jgi:hypothetical protein
MLGLNCLFYISIFLSLRTAQAVSDDQKTKDTANPPSSNAHQSQIPIERLRRGERGYYSKAQTSLRTAEKYMKEGKYTDFNEAFKDAQKDFTENKRLQKVQESVKNKALGKLRNRAKDFHLKQRKDYIVTTRVLKLVGRETDLTKIQQAKRIGEAEYRRKKRESSARSALKKKAAAAAAATQKNNRRIIL